MEYSLATIWTEFEIIRIREGGRMASESILMQSMLTGWFSGKNEQYLKSLDGITYGG